MKKANVLQMLKFAGCDKRLWLGLGVSLLLLFILFRRINYGRLLAAFSEMDYRYLLVSVLFTLIGYFLRAVRWKLLLTPLKDPGMRNVFSATIIGYMANNLLPARLGEFVRAYILGEREQIDKSAVLATLVMDRLVDGFSVLLLLVIALFTIKLPNGGEEAQKYLEYGGYATLLASLIVVLFLAVMKKYPLWTMNSLARLLKPLPTRFTAKVIPLSVSFIEGIRFPSSPLQMTLLLITSILVWAQAVWTLDLTLQAFSIDLPVTAVIIVLLFLVLAVMVPASPGSVGTFHAACVYGLMAYGLPKEKALSVALMVHGINFFPVIFLGLYYLLKENSSILDLKANLSP
jgi:uncharacterized protein (TIRG00374 family)